MFSLLRHGQLSHDVWQCSGEGAVEKFKRHAYLEESGNDVFGVLACQTDSEIFVQSSVFNVAVQWGF